MTLLATLANGPKICLGIDPTSQVLGAWGCPDTADGLDAFVDLMLVALPEQTSVAKPQIAYFERFGSHGLRALERLCAALRTQAVSVILDAKRGDIPSTNQGYVAAYLGAEAPCAVDALTVSPYLGVDSLEPFVRAARQHDRVIFVLAKTSNPEARALQDVPAQEPLWRRVAGALADEDQHVGFVVGASDPDLSDFAQGTFGSRRPLLVPGTGTQGGDLSVVGKMLGQAPAAVNISRQLLLGGADGLRRRFDLAQDELSVSGSK